MIPFSFWAGRAYRRAYRRGPWFDHASRHELLGYQETQLGKILSYAVNNIPAYRPLLGIVERFRPFDAIRDFPLLDKATVQHHLHDYLARDFNTIPHYEITTGGTSGNQLRFYVDDHSQAIDMAFAHRCWKRTGYLPLYKRATFRGVNFPNLKPGIFWQLNPIYNEIQFSPFHMSESNMGLYFQRLIDYKPMYLYGYPSAIDTMAEYVLRHGLEGRLPSIKAALLVSEATAKPQRERIESAFHTRVFTLYGHSERVLCGGECEATTHYHQFPDYGYLEIINEDGATCDRDGERGELIGTGFLCRSMPLIRYRTGDYATRLDHRCECGRNWDRFTDVLGRWKQDMIIGRNSARISIAALNMHENVFRNVVRYQYYQEEPGVCDIRLMINEKFTAEDRTAIEKAYLQKVGGAVEIRPRVVDNIPLTARGKLKLLVSTLTAPSEDSVG